MRCPAHLAGSAMAHRRTAVGAGTLFGWNRKSSSFRNCQRGLVFRQSGDAVKPTGD